FDKEGLQGHLITWLLPCVHALEAAPEAAAANVAAPAPAAAIATAAAAPEAPAAVVTGVIAPSASFVARPSSLLVTPCWRPAFSGSVQSSPPLSTFVTWSCSFGANANSNEFISAAKLYRSALNSSLKPMNLPYRNVTRRLSS
ncbi:hypothetical protein OC835_007462, partial [Tilletia horrida]